MIRIALESENPIANISLYESTRRFFVTLGDQIVDQSQTTIYIAPPIDEEELSEEYERIQSKINLLLDIPATTYELIRDSRYKSTKEEELNWALDDLVGLTEDYPESAMWDHFVDKDVVFRGNHVEKQVSTNPRISLLFDVI
ncbi:MAG: hypothetical protein Q7S14_01230 [bacterium]|nr:hypothetical protein [bacterium]